MNTIPKLPTNKHNFCVFLSSSSAAISPSRITILFFKKKVVYVLIFILHLYRAKQRHLL
jgi:hypothetical protein